MREKAPEISACEAITVAAVANAMSGQRTFGSGGWIDGGFSNFHGVVRFFGFE
jgi:hypothetical protein